MASEWIEIPLGEAITLQRGFDLPTQERKVGNIPVVSSSGISGYHDEARVKAPGVVTGRYGTIGEVFLVREDFWPLNTTLYVKDFKGNDERFISYLLRTLNFLSHNDKSSVPGVNRNHLHLIPVSMPKGVEEQRAIAHILGTLDDKIELNRKINETLEAMARALFQSWFVDFDPVGAKAAVRREHPRWTDAEVYRAALPILGNFQTPILGIFRVPITLPGGANQFPGGNCTHCEPTPFTAHTTVVLDRSGCHTTSVS